MSNIDKQNQEPKATIPLRELTSIILIVVGFVILEVAASIAFGLAGFLAVLGAGFLAVGVMLGFVMTD